MTNEEAISYLEIAVPIKALTQEEFNRFIEALNMAFKALEQEPCEDCISRKRLKECFHKNVVGSKVFDELIDMQPPVNPQKIGHWIIDKEKLGYYISKCSACGHIYHGNDILIYRPKYCANCGCHMVEPQESEE